jgi:hypothetical protein
MFELSRQGQGVTLLCHTISETPTFPPVSGTRILGFFEVFTRAFTISSSTDKGDPLAEQIL